MSCYAIKSIDDIELNKIVYSWKECADIVLYHDAVYKKSASEEEALIFFNEIADKQRGKKSCLLPEVGTQASYVVKICTKIYQNEENGFGVAKFIVSDENDILNNINIICRGYYLPNVSDFRYVINGKWIKDKKYGKQLQVFSYNELLEQDKDAVLNYLSSGAIKGIGAKLANKIYEEFGENTLAILDKDPNQILKIKGISENKLEKIIKSYSETRCAKEIISYLQKFHIPSSIGYKAYKEYGIYTISKIKKNPYILCRFRGITFEIADEIGKRENIPATDKRRVLACARQVLKNNELEYGSLGMDLEKFGNKVLVLLNDISVTKEFVNTITIEMIKEQSLRFKKISDTEKYIYLPEILEMEERTANNILRLASTEPEAYTHINALIYDKEGEYGIDLDETQIEAIQGSLENNFCIITGGPGTGKTTIVKIIASIWERVHKKEQSLFMAPTGRAARRIKESTGYDAMTIHKRLAIREDEEPEDILIEEKLIIIDEVSMLDAYLADKLFKSIEDGAKVILIGDVNQLHSVGPGSVLKDIIESNVIKVFHLNTVHRQDEGNSICENAEKINKGIVSLTEDDNFKIFLCDSPADMQNKMIRNYIHDVSIFGMDNVSCLCPIRERTAGVKEMNAALQKILNPYNASKPELEKNGIIFRLGDMVMQLRNQNEVSNGDIGIIKDIYSTKEGKFMKVEFFNTIIEEYDWERINELALAYAMTIHKSQGSEYTAVHTCIHKNYPSAMRTRNMLTTSITRSRLYTNIYIDSYTTLQEAIINKDTRKRNTLLCYYLKLHSGKYFVPAS